MKGCSTLGDRASLTRSRRPRCYLRELLRKPRWDERGASGDRKEPAGALRGLKGEENGWLSLPSSRLAWHLMPRLVIPTFLEVGGTSCCRWHLMPHASPRALR